MKKLSVIMLVLALLVTVLPSGQSARAAGEGSQSMKAGDIFVMGSYPQTRVTDSSLITKLNSATKSWSGYPYYAKNPSGGNYPTAKDTGMMSYADFEYGGERFRAVMISNYRPVDVTKPADSEYKQASNGYVKYTVYYFKYEPIRWVLLDPSTGLAVSLKVLDSQPFCAYYKIANNKAMSAYDDTASASNYAVSTVQKWLNGGTGYGQFNFINTAFSSSERGALKTNFYSFVDNSKVFNSYDLVFLLAKSDADKYKSAYYGTDNTDYAESQGMSKGTAGNGTPWFTSTSYGDRTVYYCYNRIQTIDDPYLSKITSTATGIRPAIKVDLSSSCVVKPFKISATNSPSQPYPELSWESRSGASSYEVYRLKAELSPDDESIWGSPIATLGASQTSFIDTTAISELMYYYKVKAVKSSDSEMSDYVRENCRLMIPKITGTAVDPATGQPKITWEKVQRAQKYRILRTGENTENWVQIGTVEVSGSNATYTFQDAKAVAGNYYRYKVVAESGVSTAYDSESVVKKLRCRLAKPTGVTATDDPNGLPKIVWNTVTNAGAYRVQYKKTSGTEWKEAVITSASYVLSDAEPGASYSVRVYAEQSASTVGSAFESGYVTVTCTCATPPAITQQPKDYLVFENKVQLWPTIHASGRGLTFAWYAFCPKAGETGYSLRSTSSMWSVIPGRLDDGMMYYCVVTDAFGRSVQSETGMIAALSHPEDQTVNVGETAVFSVDSFVLEHVKAFQWQTLAPGSDTWKDSPAASAKTATYSIKTVAAHNGYQVRCVATFYNGDTSTSWPADLTVKVAKPTITTQPKNASVGVGYEASFSVAAKGTGTLSYQWQAYNPSTKKWVNSGSESAKTATLKITVQTGHHNYKFRCIVKDSNGSTTSQEATLTVRPGITTQPSDTTVAVGATAKFTVAAKGIGTLKYQWQAQSPGSTEWKNSSAPSAKTATLNITAQVGHNGYKFRCVITDANGNSSVTRGALLTVKPGFTTQPKATTVAVGSTAKFTVAAKGVGTLTYQWQAYNPNTGSWTNSSAPGAKSATLSITAQAGHNNFKFRCVVTDANGRTNTSSAALLTIKVTITTQPKNVTVNAGTTAKFTIAAKGVGTLSYQWQRWDTASETWVNSTASGAKTATLSVPGQKTYSGNEYRCIVSDANDKAISNTVTLTVK